MLVVVIGNVLHRPIPAAGGNTELGAVLCVLPIFTATPPAHQYGL